MMHFRTHYRESVLKRKVPTHLVEANQDCTPIKIDLDFHYESESQKRLYTKKHVEQFIQLYMSVMEEYLISLQPEERMCIVMEKPEPVKNTKQGPNACKDGIHIIFPKIICHHTLQSLFRKQVVKQMWSCFPRNVFTNPWEDILDSHIIRSSGWQMLGSCKPGKTAYAITYMYDVFEDRILPKDVKEFDQIELLEMTTMLGYDETDCILIRQDKKEEVEKRMAAAKPKKRYQSQIRPHVVRNFGVNLSSVDTTTIDLVKKFVELLRPERSHSYNSWIELGWCLHNIHNIDHTLLDVWIEFSK